MTRTQTLRDYQQRAVDMVRARIHERPILRLDTGAGKTSVASDIIRRTVDRGRRAIFLVHRRELAGQAVERLAQFGVDAGLIMADEPEDRSKQVQVASIPTLVRREHWPAELVVVDECAHAVSESWARVVGRYLAQDPPAFLLGLTATPCRLDGRGLGSMFGCIVEPVSMRELIDRGHLVEPSVFAPPIDLSGVKVRAGEYDMDSLATVMEKFTGSITATWQERAPGARTVVFAVNVEHSMRIVQEFCKLGVAAAHIDFQTPKRERDSILRDLRAGVLDIVSQVQLLSEGWDLPSLQCAILARPTKSLALFRQMVGRVMRPPGPVVVLDHAGNHHEHGLVTDPIEWTLDDTVRVNPAASVRTCMACFAIVPPWANVCPECEAPLGRGSDIAAPPVHAPGELVEITGHGAPVFERATKDAKEIAYRQLVVEASDRGWKLGAARIRYKDRFGTWPKLHEIERELYVCSGHEWERKEFGHRTVTRCARCFETRNT